MRFLFCINDDGIDNLPATRHTFNEFLNQGMLTAYMEYGYQIRVKTLGSISKMENELFHVIFKFRPDVIHWNQINESYNLSKKFIKKIKDFIPHIIITQETVDSFAKLPLAMLRLGRNIDLTLMNCKELVDQMNRNGCNNCLYFPEKSTETLFSNSSYPKINDVVFIGNNNISRNIFKNREELGPRYRNKLIIEMKSYFGERFKVYGRNWEKSISKTQGFVKFSEQERVMKSSRLIFGCNIRNYYTFYFSNRLVNSMLSGVPVLYQYNPGLEKLFQDKIHLFYYDGISDGIKLTEELLNYPQHKLDEIGYNAKKLILAKHTARERYKYYFKLLDGLKHGNLNKIKSEFFLEEDLHNGLY